MWEQAELDYMKGMKYKDIAEKYNVSINTVKSWKKRYNWNRKSTHTKRKKCAHKTAHKNKPENDAQSKEKEQILNSAVEEPELTDKQRLFCIFYLSSHNAVISYKRAYQCSYISAAGSAYRLLENARIKNFINNIKNDMSKNMLLRATDVVDMYMRIAFANINNFALVKDGELVVADSDDIDGQLVKSIKQGKCGIEIKLADRMKALQWLSDYFGMNPHNQHKEEFDKQMLNLRERELKIKEDGW